MNQQQIYSVQEWLHFDSILNNGIIKLKDNSYVKLIKVYPINFNLKSNLEKEAILNSYKLFLKTCNFDIQILIQSNKEDLSKHISEIEDNIKEEENDKIKKFSSQYVFYIQKINEERKSSSKNFYILIKEIPKIENEINTNSENTIINNLNEKYFKIKECLNRCGNVVNDINNKIEVTNIVYSFYNFECFEIKK